jgi:ABC-type multidrug transport system fused ATPase/permease subunit
VTAIIPVMGVFVYAGYRMLPAFRDLLRAKASFRFTEEIFSSIEGALDQSKGKALAVERDVSEITFEEAIRLDDVSYSYPQAGESAVEDLHIEIPKNATVGLVGKTGAGKTTIVDILLGLLRPTEGALAIDGRRIDGSNAADWQANVGYVPQDIFLADTSIRANIAYGVSDEDIDDDAVERAARIAQIHDFVDDLPDGYDTVVGEDGVRLSGGQRQRIGIARALYRDPPVLVLDEATSDIDGATQESISDAIQNMKGERTLVLVAHRFETIRQCDRIYVISEGEIEASGSFTDLMASNEHFRELAGGTAVQQAEA